MCTDDLDLGSRSPWPLIKVTWSDVNWSFVYGKKGSRPRKVVQTCSRRSVLCHWLPQYSFHVMSLDTWPNKTKVATWKLFLCVSVPERTCFDCLHFLCHIFPYNVKDIKATVSVRFFVIFVYFVVGLFACQQLSVGQSIPFDIAWTL